jgi:hypothetical protein
MEIYVFIKIMYGIVIGKVETRTFEGSMEFLFLLFLFEFVDLR